MDEEEGEEGALSRGPIRVLICDDHAVFRQGLRMVLESEPDVEVVGEADDGGAAASQAEETAPDIVLMDVRMPGLSGIDATRRIAEVVPTAKIIMLTVSDDEADLYEAVKAGAAGYLLKEISIEEVGEAVRSVYAGQTLISPALAGKVLTEFTSLAHEIDAPVQVPTPTLSERELEVLRLAADGLTNKAIAAELFIAPNTVKNHFRNILEKLHLHSRLEAVVFAVREKLLDIE